MDENSCCSTFLPEFDVSVLNLGGSDGKSSACNVGDPCLIPGSGSSPGEGNGSPLQWSCLENSMNREAWQFTVHGIAKSQIWLRDFTLLQFQKISAFLHFSLLYYYSLLLQNAALYNSPNDFLKWLHFLNWGLVSLQCCVRFKGTVKWLSLDR